ncbi:MAG: hypothetical protein M5U09_27180 [Gammaproteobacteria bacterium]|nr:hypothetical protein [Gammaproteobacteria bacterium]
MDDAGGAERTTYYIGARYEHIVSAEGEVSRFNVIYAGAVIAVIENAAGAAPDTHYLHSDRLGSVVAMSDAHGHLVERFRFDPFGERRIAVYDGTTGEAANLVRITSRGFTGHRELASLGLIHMGGRVYDPGIGRFLSADPYIQSPCRARATTATAISPTRPSTAPTRAGSSAGTRRSRGTCRATRPGGTSRARSSTRRRRPTSAGRYRRRRRARGRPREAPTC